MIRPMQPADVPAVSRLHAERIPGLLARLGRPAAGAWYRAALATGEGIGLVAVEGSELAGFVFGAVHPAGLRASIVRRHPGPVLATTLAGVLRRPASLPGVLRGLRGPPPGAYDADVPELIYLATAAGRQGGGVGQALVARFTDVIRGCGVAGYELSVDEDNARAIGFYERAGFRPVGSYREFGSAHRRYRFDLALGSGTTP